MYMTPLHSHKSACTFAVHRPVECHVGSLLALGVSIVYLKGAAYLFDDVQTTVLQLHPICVVMQYVTLLFIGCISATSLRGFLKNTQKVGYVPTDWVILLRAPRLFHSWGSQL